MSTFSQEELPRSPKDDGFFEGADLLPCYAFTKDPGAISMGG